MFSFLFNIEIVILLKRCLNFLIAINSSSSCAIHMKTYLNELYLLNEPMHQIRNDALAVFSLVLE